MGKELRPIGSVGVAEQRFKDLLGKLPSSQASEEDLDFDWIGLAEKGGGDAGLGESPQNSEPGDKSRSSEAEAEAPREPAPEREEPAEVSVEASAARAEPDETTVEPSAVVENLKETNPELFVFKYGESQFGAPVNYVSEIIRDFGAIETFSSELPGCVGSIVYRDRLVPIFETNRIADSARVGADDIASTSVIIISFDGVEFGLSMDQHLDVVIPSAEKSWAAADFLEIANLPRFVGALVGYKKATLTILDIESLSAEVKNIFGTQDVIEADGYSEIQFSREDVISWDKYICATIESLQFLVSIEDVLEVIEGCEVTPLFKTDPMLRGLINVRGQVIACIDISGEIGVPLRVLDERNQFILLKNTASELALCVDRVLGIQSLQSGSFQSSDTVLKGSVTDVFDGVYEDEKGTLLRLCAENIFNSPKLSAYQKGK